TPSNLDSSEQITNLGHISTFDILSWLFWCFDNPTSSDTSKRTVQYVSTENLYRLSALDLTVIPKVRQVPCPAANAHGAAGVRIAPFLPHFCLDGGRPGF